MNRCNFVVMMDIRVIILVVLGNKVIRSVQGDGGPMVDTAVGTIRGLRSDDGQYNLYMGIPYAKVNKSNPFGKSIPYPYFEEIFEANVDSSMCPQIDEFNKTVVGDLGCLRVNIYTPTNVNSSSQLPVFVWIFGGKYNVGSYGRFMYGPKFLVRHDIIVVTMNYRLSVYGFMCLDIPEVAGNQGLKDQIAALRWIKSHISAFGGDPEQITLGGNSSGATSADFHLHRDKAEEKLFDKVILQSGSTLTTPFKTPVRDAPIILANFLQFQTDDVYAAIEFLATVPPHDLVVAQNTLGLVTNTVCLEISFNGVENYLTTNWYVKQFIPAVDSMKVLIGYTDDEMGCLRDDPLAMSVELRNKFNTHHEDFEGMSELVNLFYLAGGPEAIDGVLNLKSDVKFIHPMYRTLYKYIENNAGNIYFYNFSYVGDRNLSRRKSGVSSFGACHADELGYIFDMEYILEQPSADDQLLIDKMTKMWTNFIKYGDPTPESTQLINTKWLPIRRNSPMYTMNIDKQLSLNTNSVAGRVTFWDVFYEKNGHLQWPLLNNLD